MQSEIKFKISFSIFLIFFSNNLLFSQLNSEINPIIYIPVVNNLTFGVEKIVNTFSFNLAGYYESNLLFGRIKINQNYTGSALRSGLNSFRDNELLAIDYSVPLFEKFSGLLRQNWLYSSDTRSIGLNELSRLNGSMGLRYDFNSISFFEITSGAERNSQVGIVSPGSIFDIKGSVKNLSLFDFICNSDLNGELLNLNYNRTNKDFDWKIKAGRVTDDNNNLDLSFSYKLMNRDYISPIDSIINSQPLIESRYETRFLPNISGKYQIFRFLSSSFNLNLSNLNVSREFRQPIEQQLLSKVVRNLHEFQLSGNIDFNFNFNDFTQSVVLLYQLRNEENTIQSKFNINKNDFDNLRQSENQRDNNSSKTRLNLLTNAEISTNDSIKLYYSVSLLQYNTPSIYNNDDRDEYQSIGNIIYSHKFSNYLKFSILGELQFYHLVFLKSERSALNNWNRIIRLNPNITWQLDNFMMSPQLEVLANYTVYDYEDITPGIKSFSYRQISYRDTLYLKLNNQLSLQSQLIFTYFERGILFWKSFSEWPQSSNLKETIKVMIFSKLNTNLDIGIGVRYYGFNQKDINSQITGISSGNFIQKSIGPETNILYSLSNNSKLGFIGWYEFQSTNNQDKRIIPNFNLYCICYL